MTLTDILLKTSADFPEPSKFVVVVAAVAVVVAVADVRGVASVSIARVPRKTNQGRVVEPESGV